jgi:hypothetical protein
MTARAIFLTSTSPTSPYFKDSKLPAVRDKIGSLPLRMENCGDTHPAFRIKGLDSE